jgi:hypothetical protein
MHDKATGLSFAIANHFAQAIDAHPRRLALFQNTIPGPSPSPAFLNRAFVSSYAVCQICDTVSDAARELVSLTTWASSPLSSLLENSSRSMSVESLP